jgi:DNA binding domain, excisionase family
MDDIKTLTTAEAAKILKAHPATVSQKAKRGEIPAKKVGRGWVFSELALQQYLMGQLSSRAMQGDTMEEKTCHSSNVKQVRTGITRYIHREVGKKYMEALAPRTGRRRRNSTTG